MIIKKLHYGLIGLVFIFNSSASTLTGLQECQAIKNSAKKAECYDRQTKKIIQEQNEKNKIDEQAKIDAENAKAEEARKAADDAKRVAEEAKKAADDAKKVAEEKLKIEKAQKVLQIVRRLQNRVETGVAYREYASIISDPKFEVQNYIRESSNEIPDFSTNITSAMNYYDAAGRIWGFIFAGRRVSKVTCEQFQENFINSVLSNAYIRKDTDVNAYCQGYVISAALQVAWNKASESIAEANKAIQKKQEEVK